jgi:hypothetical protein
MSLTLNTLVYNQDSFTSPNKVQYTGPSNTFASKDLISLGRTAPKPTATYAGNARSEVKRTKTVTTGTDLTADAIITVSCSLPVGMAQADVDALRNDVGDFLVSTEGGTLLWNHDLTY